MCEELDNSFGGENVETRKYRYIVKGQISVWTIVVNVFIMKII